MNFAFRKATFLLFDYLFIIFLPFAGLIAADSLKNATVVTVVQQVNLVTEDGQEKAAQARDILLPRQTVRTGAHSGSQIVLPNRSFIKLGSHSVFSLGSSDSEIVLSQGMALVSAPRGEILKIKTPTVSIEMQGDIAAVCILPNGQTRIVALSTDENPIKVSHVSGKDSKGLASGRMLDVRKEDSSLPSDNYVNLGAFVQSSALFSGGQTQAVSGGDTSQDQSATKISAPVGRIESETPGNVPRGH